MVGLAADEKHLGFVASSCSPGGHAAVAVQLGPDVDEVGSCSTMGRPGQCVREGGVALLCFDEDFRAALRFDIARFVRLDLLWIRRLPELQYRLILT